MVTSDISIKSRWNPHHLPIDFPIDFPMVKTSRPVARLRPSQRPPSPGAGPAPSDGAARGQEGGAWWISAKLVGAAGWFLWGFRLAEPGCTMIFLGISMISHTNFGLGSQWWNMRLRFSQQRYDLQWRVCGIMDLNIKQWGFPCIFSISQFDQLC